VAQPAANIAEKPFVHPLFSDNMVLQRDIAAPVWGWTTPGQRVTVTMSGKTATAVADTTGKMDGAIGRSLPVARTADNLAAHKP
jgi:sialate O-acetylesterase